jgi:hypothetical protein
MYRPLFLGLVVTLLNVPAALAAPISIFGTGLDNSGNQLVGNVLDPHWTLVGSPMTWTGGSVSTLVPGFPLNAYLPDFASLASRWVMPGDGTASNHPAGVYTYETTFDLTGFDPSTANITGRWIADNQRLRILLNSTPVVTYPSDISNSFLGNWLSFTIASGFVSGVNTLRFEVQNNEGPTAIRVELSGTATPIPEPLTLAVFGLMTGGAGFVALRRKGHATV